MFQQLKGNVIDIKALPYGSSLVLWEKVHRNSNFFLDNCASAVSELLHMDLCGPFPIQAPRGKKYFFNILDDRSNWGFTFGL